MQHAAAPFFLIKGELRPPLDPPTGGVGRIKRPQPPSDSEFGVLVLRF
jgi:hypothetical protein